MFRKNYFTFLLTLSLLAFGGLTASAQTAVTTGKVELKKADGTVAPVAGATVDVYRTDIKGKLPSAKTNKKGEFSFAGLPLGGVFTFSISAPNVAPQIIPNVRAGSQVPITVSEGDGRRWTEDEVRQGAAKPTTTAPTGTGTAAQTTAPAPANGGGEQKKQELTAEQKKQQAEYEAKVKDITAKNAKAEQTNKIVNQVLQEGNKAFADKNYDLAIAKFDEGYNADPDFAGSAPVLLNNKAKALLNRATNTYNANVKADAATRTAANATVKKDLSDAADATNRALEVLKAATTTDAAVQKGYDANKFDALASRKEAYRLMAKTGADRTKGKEAATAFEEYIAVETDAKRKADAQLALGLALQDSNEFDMAIAAFEKVLAVEPSNIDALAGAGLSLINVAYVGNDKAKFQQGANYLQKFVDSAPATHPFKDDAQALIESLKKEQNVAPQKGAGKKKS